MTLAVKQFTRRANVGDVVGSLILATLYRGPIEIIDDGPAGRPNLIGLGSILQWADTQSVIWGSGLIAADAPFQRPRAIFAVRGRLTREVLLRKGIACPPVFGDPGVLLAEIYPRRHCSEGKVGVIPHYVDADEGFVAQARAAGAVIIDPLSPPDEYFDRLARCSRVISSSLHGIIFAHAYGIPATWIQLSSRVLGDGFKFYDYFSSIGVAAPERLGSDTGLETALQACVMPVTEIDKQALKGALVDAVAELTDPA